MGIFFIHISLINILFSKHNLTYYQINYYEYKDLS